jgi:DNA/RNA-binding domain of Phe-tRNA-synthetase-like protein
MSNLTIAVDAAVLAQFPDLACGAFIVRGLSDANVGQFLLDTETLQARLAALGLTEGTVLQHPAIAAWRRAIQSCGLKAAKFRSSAEQLVRRGVRCDEIKAPGDIVQLYCQVSALHVAPLGGYDLETLPTSDIAIRYAQATDNFQPLGGNNGGDMGLDNRVVVYATGENVICWGFNVRDDCRTALRESTVNALFTTEAVYAEQRLFGENALAALRQYLHDGGANVTSIVWTDYLGFADIGLV